MSRRQLTMMSLGGAIGTGLFIGSGSGIAAAGPAVVVSFAVAGFLVILLMNMMAEMAAARPDAGAFSVYAEKAMGFTAGAVIGWLYWIQAVVVIAAEATAAAAITAAWFPAIPQGVWVLAFLAVFTAVNLMAVSGFGTFEYWFAMLKVLAIVGLLAVGAAMIFGLLPGVAAPGLDNLFGHGGFAPHGITGICSALLIVVFAFGGTEIVTIAAAESDDPARNIGRAVRSVLVRILVFYIGSVLVMVTVLPWNSTDLAAGPFVAVLKAARLSGVETVMAAVIVIALLSALNANLYGASRMLLSLSRRRIAPQALGRRSANGAPRPAVLACVAFGAVTVVLNFLAPDLVLPMLLRVVGSTVLVVWVFVAVSQLLLRRRADREGTPLSFRMWGFPYLSVLALLLLAAIMVLAMLDPANRIQLLSTIGLTVLLAVLCRIFVPRPAPVPAAGHAGPGAPATRADDPADAAGGIREPARAAGPGR
ncbi:amino acid permease [Arthrobacter sp. E918]|uniref:Amino acid permease n=2 Tax=Arthrobacter mobilis TaxID=2724944 RepID=A0A7X6K788_9MICC|nr:amino acid permease [Arthrobacter mobilis]